MCVHSSTYFPRSASAIEGSFLLFWLVYIVTLMVSRKESLFLHIFLPCSLQDSSNFPYDHAAPLLSPTRCCLPTPTHANPRLPHAYPRPPIPIPRPPQIGVVLAYFIAAASPNIDVANAVLPTCAPRTTTVKAPERRPMRHALTSMHMLRTPRTQLCYPHPINASTHGYLSISLSICLHKLTRIYPDLPILPYPSHPTSTQTLPNVYPG